MGIPKITDVLEEKACANMMGKETVSVGLHRVQLAVFTFCWQYEETNSHQEKCLQFYLDVQILCDTLRRMRHKQLISKPPQTPRSVDEYIERLGNWQGEVVSELRKLVQSTVPKAEESIRWSQLVYELNGPICFIKAFRSQVTLGFWRGDQLHDPHKLLCQSLDQIKYIKLTEISHVHKSQFRELLKTAARLNLEFGDPTKRND